MEQNQPRQSESAASISFSSLEAFLQVSPVSYHELDEVPVRHEDQLEVLQRNVVRLADLQRRLRFMSTEIRYLMKF